MWAIDRGQRQRRNRKDRRNRVQQYGGKAANETVEQGGEDTEERKGRGCKEDQEDDDAGRTGSKHRKKSTGASALEGDPIDLVMQELGRIKDNSSREVNGKLSFTRANQQAIRDGCDVVGYQ
ncbi:hypothetical protein Trydic_g18247 [Trypoxylus dichotomus]